MEDIIFTNLDLIKEDKNSFFQTFFEKTSC